MLQCMDAETGTSFRDFVNANWGAAVGVQKARSSGQKRLMPNLNQHLKNCWMVLYESVLKAKHSY